VAVQIGKNTLIISLVSFLLTCTFFSFSSSAYAAQCDAQCQLTKVKVYFYHLDAISRSGSSVKHIDLLLKNMHDNVRYEHVEYQANFNKNQWRKAFIRNLNRGEYKHSVANEVRVLNSIQGKGYLAIEYAHGEVLSNGVWQSEKPLLALFGFTDGKISLIKELW
jgi:uncharacterized protein YdaL